ncbi:MAG: cell division protein FtsL [Pseudomonadota bacterium]
MNATVKSMPQQQHYALPLSFPKLNLSWAVLHRAKRSWILIMLVIAVFFSGLLTVYVQTINYQLTSKKQQLLTQQHQLNNQWNELLQTQGALANQSTISAIATNKFDMKLPNAKDIIMIRA